MGQWYQVRERVDEAIMNCAATSPETQEYSVPHTWPQLADIPCDNIMSNIFFVFSICTCCIVLVYLIICFEMFI